MSRGGTGRVYQRGKTWWIDYGFRGDRYRESSGSTRKGEAIKLLRKRMAEMGSGKLVGPDPERVTFEDLTEGILNDYRVNGRKSIRRLRTSIKHLRDAFGRMKALKITTVQLRKYVTHRQEEGAANATIRQELAHLKRAFNLALQAGQLPGKPHFPTIRVDNTREGFFEPDELAAILRELPTDLRAPTRFAALTGWRKAEVLGLTWDRVDFEAGEVRLDPGTTKNREGRSFPFAALPPLADLLHEQREHTRAVERATGQVVPHVFHRDGRPIIQMRKAWNAAAERAGVPGRLFHDLRRTAVRNLERAGVPRSVAMKLTGHKTESVYRRYAIADRGALEEGVEKLARLHAATPAPQRKVVPLREAQG